MTEEQKRLQQARAESKQAARMFEDGELTEAQLWRILESEEDALIAVTRKRDVTNDTRATARR